jgi:hypothetical protein
MGEAKRPKPRLADDAAQRLRDHALNLLADAAIHAERLGSAAEKLGLTPDLLDGVGDQLYEAAVAQLDIASKVLERSQVIADRLLELGERRFETRPLARFDVKPGEAATLRFVVHNVSPKQANVKVELEADWDTHEKLEPTIGREQLAGGRQTMVEFVVPPSYLERRTVYAGTARISLFYESGRRVRLPRHDFEVWVHRA